MRITQVAVVVKDLRKTMEAYHKVMGWGPWSVYEHKPPILHHTRLHGQPADYSMLGAEVHCNPIDFEILQPMDGPSIYKEFLDEKGEGLHHIGFVVKDLKRCEEEAEKAGLKVVQAMKREDGSGFIYLDSDRIGGAMFELTQPPKSKS